jgi:hypothetical protein
LDFNGKYLDDTFHFIIFRIKGCEIMARQSEATEVKKQRCTCCGQEKDLTEYYMSTNILYQNLKKLPVCKECLIDTVYNFLFDESKNEVEALYDLCRLTNSYFEEFLYNSAKAESENKNGKQSNPIRIYFTKINSLPQYRMKTFKHSASYGNVEKSKDEKVIEVSKNDKKNEDDALRMLGYDPFETENLEDRKYLFNRLIDYLTEDTIEDSFKLSSSIELVKMFNQIDKINMAIATITGDAEKIASNVGGIKSLIEAKDKLYKSALALAKDNGISVNHNNSKSKGSGTLTGTIKKLQDIGLNESMINLFDIETSDGIRQVADISNENIRKQIMFDENDYSDMLASQRKLIEDMDKKLILAEEDNRLLKIKLKYYEQKE